VRETPLILIYIKSKLIYLDANYIIKLSIESHVFRNIGGGHGDIQLTMFYG
jgi:hypothetical protein